MDEFVGEVLDCVAEDFKGAAGAGADAAAFLQAVLNGMGRRDGDR